MARYEITVKNSECEITISTDEYLDSDELVEMASNLSNKMKAVESKRFYMLTVKGASSERIKAIKAVRTVTRLGLTEAKGIVDSSSSHAVKLPYALCEDEIPNAVDTLRPFFSSVESHLFS